MINSALLPVHAEMPLDERLTGLNISNSFPLIVGDFEELDKFYGNIYPLEVNNYDSRQIGLRKPALQHHRSAQVLSLSPDGSEPGPVTIGHSGQRKLVTAKGINMTRPVLGVTTDLGGRPFPFAFAYGLVGKPEVGDQVEHSQILREAGITTDEFLGSLVLDAYFINGQAMQPEEFWDSALGEYEGKLKRLRISEESKTQRLNAIREYASYPHVILLRATEAVIRLADVQDAPDIHLSEMLSSLNANNVTGYLSLLQEQAASNIKRLHELGFVHRVLYHGGNVTTAGEIIDLDSLCTAEDYPNIDEFNRAASQDIDDLANNIERLQVALRKPADAELFRSLVAA